MSFRDLFKLMRINQWYKNLVIFLPVIFFGHFFNITILLSVAIGLFSLCFVSSVNYVINDIIDREKDRLHPEKKDRPLASGTVKLYQALILIVILLVLSISLALLLPIYFFVSVITLFVTSQLYSIFFKHEVFLDILFIAINFVIRAVSGVFILNTSISPWLILCTFFLSMFLSAGKRYADSLFLGSNAASHRKTLKVYTKEFTSSLMIIITSLLILSYAMYTFLSNYKNLIMTLPIALYVMLRYFFLVYNGSEIGRQPEKFYKDLRLVIGVLLWTASIFVIIYFPLSF